MHPQLYCNAVKLRAELSATPATTPLSTPLILYTRFRMRSSKSLINAFSFASLFLCDVYEEATKRVSHSKLKVSEGV